MSSLLKAMEANLSESDVRMLKSIYEPRVVGGLEFPHHEKRPWQSGAEKSFLPSK